MDPSFLTPNLFSGFLSNNPFKSDFTKVDRDLGYSTGFSTIALNNSFSSEPWKGEKAHSISKMSTPKDQKSTSNEYGIPDMI